MGQLSVPEAAARLGVSERQVRRLAASGDLSGRRIGGRWLIDADAARSRARSEPRPGRPLSAPMAWAVLAAVSSVLEAEDDGIPLIEDRRVRHRLRSLLADAPAPERWDQWLRHRAHARRVWFHPGIVDRLAEDDRLHPVVVPAVASGVPNGARRGFYVDENVVTSVIADYRARLADDGQVVLMVVPPDMPGGSLGAPGEPVVPAAALVDLLGSTDARERHGAAAALGAACHRLASTVGQEGSER